LDEEFPKHLNTDFISSKVCSIQISTQVQLLYLNTKLSDDKLIFTQPVFQRIILLIILGYEAAGCLVGGSLLVTSPDGKYFKMPVQLLNGVFDDFLIPGTILLAMGILTTSAFISVLKKMKDDWFMAGLALGGLFVWFVVEIIILNELHPLHIMWGIPVMIGWIFAIPLIAFRHNSIKIQKALLMCGILSTLWYLLINLTVPLMYDDYSMLDLTVSELSAIGAPTRIVWVLLALLYPLLFSAFGWGVMNSAGNNKRLRVAGILIILYSVFNIYWPPMHERAVLASQGEVLTDKLHLIWAMTTVLLMMLLMGFGAAASGNGFRKFTIAIWVVFIFFGILIGNQTENVQANLPTPFLGLWERFNILAFMIWVIVFSVLQLQKQKDFSR